MKKTGIVKASVALLTAVLVLGFAGCGGGGGGGGSSDDNNANLASLTLNGAAVANLGTGGSTYAGLTNGALGSATVLSSAVIAVGTPEIAGATVQYDKVTGSAEPSFWVDNDFTFASAGEFLAIEVTAKDGKTKKYYKIAITVADVALESLTIGGKAVTLPNPATSWDSAVAGNILFDYPVADQPAGGLAIVATALTQGATIQYAYATGSTEPVFNTTNQITFADGGFLYIKVTNAEGTSSAFYKVQVYFQMEGVITYGSPTIANGVIDPLWDNPTLQVYTIEKPYLADFTAGGLEAIENGTIATGVAKALWDEQGLYIYVKVTDPEVSEEEKEGSQAHEADSVELFINEGYPDTSYARGGSQYRVGANGGRSGEGDGATLFQSLPAEWSSAWKTDDGYIVIFRAPWRLRSQYPITDGKEIGFEIQINDAPGIGNRLGTIVWNNVAHTNYMDARDYGIATLDAAGNTLNFPAAAPVITTSPVGGIKDPGESVTLTVEASMTTGNPSTSLSYQWYSATSASGEGTIIDGQTNATYTFNAPGEAGAYYYYVVVTNTLNNALGTTTASATSARAAINVSAGGSMVEQLTLSEQYAIYSFTLPEGEEYGNYYTITADYWMDADNFAKGVRSLRLMGNYLASDFNPVAGSSYDHYAFDTANAAYIYDDVGAGAIATAGGAANKWFTITYKLGNVGGPANAPNGGFVAANKPDADAAGAGDDGDEPFLFGLGIPGNSVESDANNPKTQLVRNIIMVHKDDPAKNVIGESTNKFVGYGGARFDASGRTWAPAPMVDVEQLTLSEQYAIYSFTLPAGEEYGNYYTITVDYRMDADNFAKGVRSLRLMGNYLASNFNPVAGSSYDHYAFDTANAAYIYDDVGAGAIATAGGAANKWFTITYKLGNEDGPANNPNGGFVAANKPDADAVGAGDDGDEPFLFGLGIPGNDASSDPTIAKTQLVKNIIMVHKDDPAKNVIGQSTNKFVGYGGARFDASGRQQVRVED